MQRPPIQTKSITFSSSAFSMHCRFGNIDQTGNSLEENLGIPENRPTATKHFKELYCTTRLLDRGNIIFIFNIIFNEIFYTLSYIFKKLSVRVVVDNMDTDSRWLWRYGVNGCINCCTWTRCRRLVMDKFWRTLYKFKRTFRSKLFGGIFTYQ